MAAVWWTALLIPQYLGFKWLWGNDGYTAFARQAFLPVHALAAGLVLVGARWRVGPGRLAAVWLALSAALDAATPRQATTPIAGWLGLALGGLLMVVALTGWARPPRAAAP